jgi:hypothetical protein
MTQLRIDHAHISLQTAWRACCLRDQASQKDKVCGVRGRRGQLVYCKPAASDKRTVPLETTECVFVHVQPVDDEEDEEEKEEEDEMMMLKPMLLTCRLSPYDHEPYTN